MSRPRRAFISNRIELRVIRSGSRVPAPILGKTLFFLGSCVRAFSRSMARSCYTTVRVQEIRFRTRNSSDFPVIARNLVAMQKTSSDPTYIFQHQKWKQEKHSRTGDLSRSGLEAPRKCSPLCKRVGREFTQVRDGDRVSERKAHVIRSRGNRIEATKWTLGSCLESSKRNWTDCRR